MRPTQKSGARWRFSRSFPLSSGNLFPKKTNNTLILHVPFPTNFQNLLDENTLPKKNQTKSVQASKPNYQFKRNTGDRGNIHSHSITLTTEKAFNKIQTGVNINRTNNSISLKVKLPEKIISLIIRLKETSKLYQPITRFEPVWKCFESLWGGKTWWHLWDQDI